MASLEKSELCLYFRHKSVWHHSSPPPSFFIYTLQCAIFPCQLFNFCLNFPVVYHHKEPQHSKAGKVTWKSVSAATVVKYQYLVLAYWSYLKETDSSLLQPHCFDSLPLYTLLSLYSFENPSFSFYYRHPFLCHQSFPSVLLLCVEIGLQQWTLRVMLMECIWGASSFLSPTCMQNRPNGEPLAPVYITKRGASAMVTPVDSLKTFGRRVRTITTSLNVLPLDQEKSWRNWLKVYWHTLGRSGSLDFDSCFMFLDLKIKFMSITEWKMPLQGHILYT